MPSSSADPSADSKVLPVARVTTAPALLTRSIAALDLPEMGLPCVRIVPSISSAIRRNGIGSRKVGRVRLLEWEAAVRNERTLQNIASEAPLAVAGAAHRLHPDNGVNWPVETRPFYIGIWLDVASPAGTQRSARPNRSYMIESPSLSRLLRCRHVDLHACYRAGILRESGL